MEAISNVDRLVLLLRQRLMERSKAASASRGDTRRGAAGQAATGLAQVQALAAIDDIDDRQLRRALIQSILVEQLGDQLLNEARFQQVIEQVTAAIEQDSDGAKLMSRLVEELRASAH